ELTITEAGVRVRNCSSDDPAHHQYVVSVEGGLPSACGCPAPNRFDAACTHREAVANRTPVMDAVMAISVAADGGVNAAVSP
ncbi:MAG: SWIM zinc finger family protein, partial [Halorientalis sp.]